MHKSLYYFPAVICTIAIFILSTNVSVQLPGVGMSDKVGHLIAYAVLCFLWGWGIYKAKSQVLTNNLILSILLGGLVYGIFLEIVQYSFFPNRYFEYGDILADFLGCLIASISIRLFLR